MHRGMVVRYQALSVGGNNIHNCLAYLRRVQENGRQAGTGHGHRLLIIGPILLAMFLIRVSVSGGVG